MLSFRNRRNEWTSEGLLFQSSNTLPRHNLQQERLISRQKSLQKDNLKPPKICKAFCPWQMSRQDKSRRRRVPALVQICLWQLTRFMESTSITWLAARQEDPSAQMVRIKGKNQVVHSGANVVTRGTSTVTVLECSNLIRGWAPTWPIVSSWAEVIIKLLKMSQAMHANLAPLIRTGSVPIT